MSGLPKMSAGGRAQTEISQRLPKAKRRAQLIAVATEIVKSQGVEALTMAGLAQQAGISKPVVYEHFENSEAVTLALLDAYFVKMVSNVCKKTQGVSKRIEGMG